MQLIRDGLQDDKNKQEKINRLLTYIKNNSNYIINYQKRQDNGHLFTSHMAGSTVESLINKRCKGQQHKRWSREGLHALLQVSAAVNSDDWHDICGQHISEALYKMPYNYTN